MAKPSVFTWAEGGGASVTEPSLAKKAVGWLLGEKPAHDNFNWNQRQIGLWTQWLDRQFGDGSAPAESVLTMGTSGGLLISTADGVTHRMVHFDDGGGDPEFVANNLEVQGTVLTGLDVTGEIQASTNVIADGDLQGTNLRLANIIEMSAASVGGHARASLGHIGLSDPTEYEADFFRPGAAQPALAADYTTTLSRANTPKLAGYVEWNNSTNTWDLVRGYNVDSVTNGNIASTPNANVIITLKEGMTEPLMMNACLVNSNTGEQTSDIWDGVYIRMGLGSTSTEWIVHVYARSNGQVITGADLSGFNSAYAVYFWGM